ncbi:di-trans,poly-cis-decaprenylcistransferase [Hydrogenoanaerobacterium saccharovorans]|uniref:Isoprenyl transferase n=1 Tax=Hydrogenoanaerobacterium saccharovorans TaxID=474960 RepID=A0ABS2GNV6_9FIRM|nr:polyprenyl diphosphate synthase [Hydrogenoanaerobacterium saccharovorans]MBM6924190.1 di-trans,poly-cis-decaprenylcistransferase [Hydrogenoanaerobacterium saccharovorans]
MAEQKQTGGMLPEHIGIIMDGNGRWAQKRGLPRSAGHKQGARTFREIVRYCRSIGIRYLTVYAFSTENWKRPQSEIDAIMNLLRDYLDELERHSDEEQGVLRFIGDMAPLAEDLRQRITDVQERTAGREGITVNIALNYGGRHEIVHAVQQAVSLARQGTLTPEAVDEALVDSLMYTAGQPPVDLIIRPSGEQRISNFLLWQGAYAEFVFMDVLWPDFTPGDLDRAIAEFQRRSRRFGGISS